MNYRHQTPDTETSHTWRFSWDELKDLIMASIEDVPDGEVCLLYSSSDERCERSITLRIKSKDGRKRG